MELKATRSQIKQHNHRLILRSVYNSMAETRVGLAAFTGLAKPTVSEIVTSLMEQGFLAETGYGESTESGGKRPTLLRFVPDARHVIGLSVSETGIEAALAYMDGTISARHNLMFSSTSVPLIRAIRSTVNALMAQLDAPREQPYRPMRPLLCIGVGVPGQVDSDEGVVLSSSLLGLREVALADHLRVYAKVPVYIANQTELATRAEMTSWRSSGVKNLVMLLIRETVEVSFVSGGSVYHAGGALGEMHLATNDQPLQEVFQANTLRTRWKQLTQEALPPATQSSDTMLFLHIRSLARKQHPIAKALYQEVGEKIAHLLSWVIALMRPDHITLAGPLHNLGPLLIEIARAQLAARLGVDSLPRLGLSLVTDSYLSARGAMAYALEEELGLVEGGSGIWGASNVLSEPSA